MHWGWRRSARAAVGCLGAISLLLAIAPGALASSSGDIARALVSPDWATAGIAGEAMRSNACIRPPKDEKPDKEEGSESKQPSSPSPPATAPYECGWIPFATVGPGSSLADCSGRRWGSIATGVQLAWIGPELVGPGSAGFDLPAVALQYGSAAPLLCLSAVETVPERMGCIPEIDCPGYRLVHRTYQLDSAVLEVASSPAPQSQAVPAPPPLRCKKPGKRSRQRRHKGSIGIGVATVVPVDGRRAGRCKTG